jgi:sterol desaturase/sphingolipid hydroxylase (fatty acid hydroxylase superfamily)
MTAENVMGHLGYEFYPRWLTQSFAGKWLNTSTNHNMHHRYFEGNYGLYFRWWDVWMGTTHAKYDATLLEIQSRKPMAEEHAEVSMPNSVKA